MHNITIDSDNYSLKSKWSELTTDEVIGLANIYMSGNDYSRLKIVCCLYLLGLKLKYADPVLLDGKLLYYVKHSRKRVYLLSLEQMQCLITSVEWLFYNEHTPEGKKISINPRLTFNPVKKIKLCFTSLVGPDDFLGNITFTEFIHAETFLYRYNTTGDRSWLSKFMATLWRPIRKGKVVNFDQELIERWSWRTEKVKPDIALAIMWFYQGCKFYLSKKFPRVFMGSTGKTTDPFDSFMDLTSTLAGADATKMDAVRSANLYDTLKALEQMLTVQDDYAKQISKMKKR